MINKTKYWIKHVLGAASRYQVHSPFVYEFCTKVLPHRSSDSGKKINTLRQQLLNDNTLIEIEDFGAGYNKSAQRHIRKSIKQVVKSSARRYKEGELLFRICQHYQPLNCLEFGTNLGLSTLYQLEALNNSHFITMEGAKALSTYASKHFQAFKQSPQLLTGEFTSLLNQINFSNFKLDYILLDGNHRYKPTMDYFHFLLPHLNENAIIILDDIYWSEEMVTAWKEIIQHPDITVSIDLFVMGVCFFKRKQKKEHFSLRFFAI